MIKLNIKIEDVQILPLTEGIFEQYLRDGEIIDAEIVHSDEITIEPKKCWERNLTHLIIWMETLLTALKNINEISQETHKQIQERIKEKQGG